MEGLACPSQPCRLVLNFKELVIGESRAADNSCQEIMQRQLEGEGTPVFVLVSSHSRHRVSQQGERGAMTGISYLVRRSWWISVTGCTIPLHLHAKSLPDHPLLLLRGKVPSWIKSQGVCDSAEPAATPGPGSCPRTSPGEIHSQVIEAKT